MSSRRRRADDFTDSLRSFRQTLDIEHSQSVSGIYSEDSLDTSSARNNALIVSNNPVNEQHVSSSDAYHTAEENYDIAYGDVQFEETPATDETSYMSVKLDLNKCINLFHNKHLEEEQENTSAEAAAKASNHEKVKTIIPSVDESSSESFISSNKRDDRLFMEEDQNCNSASYESTLEDIDPCELKTLLHSLDSQQKSRVAPVQGRILRRLSKMFYISPNDFTDKLLSTIEESVVQTNESDLRDFPDVSLCRLTAELRKMCKFIDNETVPEWPTSPCMSTSICVGGDEPTRLNSSERSLGTFSSPSKGFCATTPVTPIASRRNGKSPRRVFRRTPKTISAALSSIQTSVDDITNVYDSTSTFENLEAYCKRLFPDEYKPSSLQKNYLQSPLQNMSSILHTCDAQMKSLENSPSVCEPLQNVVTSTSDQASRHDTVPGTQNFRHGLVIFTPDKLEKTLSVERESTSAKQHAGRSTRREMIEPDDLEKTLLYEIAKKRQRCFDTAKIIMEIDGNSEQLAAQGACSSSNVNEAMLSAEDTKMMETLIFFKEYKDYLEEYKPLFCLLQRSESSKSRSAPSKKENVHTKKANRANVATLTVPKLSKEQRNKSRSPSPKRSPKPFVTSKLKLFVTPGKSPVSRTTCGEKRTYFPNLGGRSHKQEKFKKDSNRILSSSPSTQSICRRMGLNYDSVVSPVGMYIKGTNPHLIKNLRPKTDETLLTPRKKKPMMSADAKPEMKFRLSPKRSKKTSAAGTPTARDENIPDNFLHPKVCYKLPSHVRTIKETENRKVGNRINELLRSTQNKVVIRHEGRTKTVQTDCSEQPEIHYDSAEESVHIEQTARKTHFSRVQKDH